MKIMCWSDYACPYCYIAEARLHKAIEELGMKDSVDFQPRAFELDPTASATVQSDTAARFAGKYRLSLEEAKAQIEHISQLGKNEGIDFRYATTRYTNTFDAHRLMKLALSKKDEKLAEKTNQLLFDAYFTKNLELSSRETLLAVAELAGLAVEEVKAMLDSNQFAEEVREDERAAAARGARGVPYFVFPNGMSIPGAVSTADFKEILKQNAKLETPASNIKGAQCGPDGCSVNFSK